MEISGAMAVREMVLRLPVLAHILQRISDFLKYLACIYFEIRSTPNLRNPNKTKTKNCRRRGGTAEDGIFPKALQWCTQLQGDPFVWVLHL